MKKMELTQVRSCILYTKLSTPIIVHGRKYEKSHQASIIQMKRAFCKASEPPEEVIQKKLVHF
jgi:hypothetical protein